MKRCGAPKTPFDVRKNGTRLDEIPLKGGIKTGITYSQTFAQFTALVDAGATVDELLKWFHGEYPIPFIAYLQIGTHYRDLIRKHSEADAAAAANKKR